MARLRQLTSIVSAGLILCSALAAPQKDNKAAIALFQARYDGLTKAYLNQDVATASQYFSPDYSAGNANRPMNKQTTLDALKNWDGRFRTTQRKVLSVVINGEKAAAMTENRTEGKITDKKGPHSYVITARCMDTWVHSKQGWQLRHANVIHSAVKKDGKPIASPLPGSVRRH